MFDDRVEPAASGEPLLFDAVLYPYRSLPRTGFWILIGIVAALGFGAGIVFTFLGAWPVLGFFGAELLLLVWFFRLSYRQARLYERVQLTARRLTVRRVHADGVARAWAFQPFWLRVEIEGPPRDTAGLTLVSHGRRLTIGSFLTSEEKIDFATALRGALAAVRAPRSHAGS